MNSFLQPIKLANFKYLLAWVMLGGIPALSHADMFGWEPDAVNPNWGFPGNWAGTPNAVPDDDGDVAMVSGIHSHSPTLTSNQIVGSLLIWGGGQVHTGDGTNNFKLAVRDTGPYLGTTLIEDPLSWLVVENSPLVDDFDTNRLDVNSSGSLFINDGAQVRVRSAMGIGNNSLVSGSGRLEINGSQQVKNEGTIQAVGGTLTVAGTGAFAYLDWDGDSNAGRLRAFDHSTLNLHILTLGAFRGTMTIDADARMYMADHWEQGEGGVLNFDGDNGTATLSGNHATLENSINVQSGTAVFEAATTFGHDSSLNLSDETTVQFDALSTMAFPSSFNNGFRTTLVINDTLNIGTGHGHFDWDGAADGFVDGRTIVNPGGRLNINVDSIDELGAEEKYGGRLTINSGSVQVQNDDGQWEMQGTLVMNKTTDIVPELTGTGVLVTGNVTVSGNGRSLMIASPTFDSTSQINVSGGAELLIDSQLAHFDGGHLTGDGVVMLDSNLTVISSSTTVDMPNGIFDVDGNMTGDSVRIDAPLILNVSALDIASNEIDNSLEINSSGRLDVQLPLDRDYLIAGDLELNGAGGGFTSLHFAGADVMLTGTTTVTGSSTSQARMGFAGTTSIAAGGSLRLQGGTPEFPNFIRHDASFSGDGDLIVLPGAQLDVDEGAGMGVHLQNQGRVELNHHDPDHSIGRVVLDGNYVQLPSGQIGMELAEAGHDWLQVAGVISLAGAVEISTVESFAPAPGSVFALMTSGLRAGTFDSLSIVTPDQLKLSAELQYTSNAVFLHITEASLFGDFNGDLLVDCHDIDALVAELAAGGTAAEFDLNGDASVDAADLDLWLAEAGNFNVGAAYRYGDATLDGVVDVSDFNVWNDHRFSAGTGWCSGDFTADGWVDVGDFNVWNGNKFGAAAIQAAAVPEPEFALARFLSLAFIVGQLRAKRLTFWS